MKKVQFIPMVAAIAGIMLALTTTAFTKVPEKKALLGTSYFKFSVNDTPSEANFEDVSLWTAQASLPGSNPCNAGTAAPCIVHVDNTAAGISSGDNASARLTKFINYMISLTPSGSGASTHVANNTDFQRQ